MLARTAFIAALRCTGAVVRAANVDVTLAAAAGSPLADAVAMLEPVGAKPPVRPMAGAQIARHDLQFSPQVSVVTVGTPVMFPNHASLDDATPPQLLPVTVGSADVELRVKLGPRGFAK